MRAVALRARADLRRRWLAWLTVAALVGLSGGAVAGTVAAAGRADTAYDRFLAATNPMDVAVQGSNDIPYEALAALPEVVESAPVEFVLLYEQDELARPEDEGLNGEGVLMTQGGLERLSDAPRNLFAVAFAAGVDPEAAAGALRSQLGVELYSLGAAPEEVADFGSVDALPVILAGMLAAVGAVTLAHVVLYGVRRRQRESPC